MKGLFYFVFAVLLISCTEEFELEGSITGNIKLRQIDGLSYSLKDISVLLESGEVVTETYTDESGIFEFRNIKKGNYKLTFSKEGFGSRTIENFTYLGFGKNAVIENITLFQIPKVDFLDAKFSLKGNQGGYTIVEGFVTSAPGTAGELHLSLFFARTANVDNENYTYSTEFSDIKFVEGDTIFVKDFFQNLPLGEKWFMGIYSHYAFDYPPNSTLNKAFEILELTVD